MAQSLRRPLFGAVGLTSFSSPIRRRCFSQIQPLRAAPGKPQGPVGLRPSQRPDRSVKAMSKELAQMPNDIGMLEKTFIRPTNSNSPNLFTEPRRYLKLRYKILYFRIRNEVSLQILRWSSPKVKSFFRRTLKINRAKVRPTAVELHKQMYSSFAEGDVVALRQICTDGVFESFSARLGQRPRNEIVKWELLGYNGRVKVMSYRAARLPIDGLAILQAVVKISSKQKLTRWRKERGGKQVLVPGTGKERNVVEYVVIQRRVEGWKGDEWQIWGTTQENTLEDIEKWEKAELE